MPIPNRPMERSEQLRFFLSRFKAGSFPLHEAVVSGEGRRVINLLNAGFDPENQLPLGTKPLHLAAQLGDIEMTQLLLEAGADVNARDRSWNTPLHCCAWRWNEDDCLELIEPDQDHGTVCKLLLAAGASIDATNSQKQTPLHLAIKASRSESEFPVVEYLLSAGASLTHQDRDGWSALHYLSCGLRPELYRLLMRFGPDLTQTTSDGKSIYELVQEWQEDCYCLGGYPEVPVILDILGASTR